MDQNRVNGISPQSGEVTDYAGMHQYVKEICDMGKMLAEECREELDSTKSELDEVTSEKEQIAGKLANMDDRFNQIAAMVEGWKKNGKENG